MNKLFTKAVALLIAFVLSIPSGVYVWADDVGSFANIINERFASLITDTLLLPGEKHSDNSNYLAMDKGYSAIWSNYSEITTGDIFNICSFYDGYGNELGENDVSLELMPVIINTDSTCGEVTSSSYDMMADFLCVLLDNESYYYIPFVAVVDDMKDEAAFYQTLVQKPKITVTDIGTPDYFINSYYTPIAFKSKNYQNYKFSIDFYNEDEIYFKNGDKEKKYQFIQETDRMSTGDFYSSTTDTDGDFVFSQSNGEAVLICDIEDASLGSVVHYVPAYYENEVLRFPFYDVTGIEISVEPDKLVYVEGETFDPTGMIITLSNYDYEITDYSYSDEQLTADDEYVEISAVIYPSTSSVYATTAETVTVKQLIKVTKKGDVNRDGSVTAEDAMLLVKILDAIKTFGDNAFEANADANNDGNVNMLDVINILAVVEINDTETTTEASTEETTVETSSETTTEETTVEANTETTTNEEISVTTTTEETTEETTTTVEIITDTETVLKNGDVNGNGIIDIVDVSNVYDMIFDANTYVIPGITDVDCNGKVDSTDVAIILQKVLDSKYLMPCEIKTSSETTTETTTEATTEATTEESINSSDTALSDEEIEALEGVIYDTKYVLIYKVKTSAEKELVQYILDAMESYLADNSYDVISAMQEAKVMYKALSNEEQDDFYSCVLAVYDMVEVTTLWDIFSILL